MINEKLFESLVRDYGNECVKITQNLIDKAYQSGKADAIEEYNGYRRKVIDITINEDFKQLKRVATVDISEDLIKALSQEDLLRVILDEITEQIQKGAERNKNMSDEEFNKLMESDLSWAEIINAYENGQTLADIEE